MLNKKNLEKDAWRKKDWTEWNAEDIKNFQQYRMSHPSKELDEDEQAEQDAEDGYFYDD